MSEPIQAIAQNNYLLATQQEVSHDNTLSGNGTVDSPLGVVPGYNETVLFSSDNKNGASAFSTSESIKNFERIAVLPARYENDNLTGTGPYMYYNTENLSGGGAPMNSICPMIFEYAFWKITRYSADDSLTTFNAVTGYQVDMTTHTYYSNQPCYVGVKQVIGINRIASTASNTPGDLGSNPGFEIDP